MADNRIAYGLAKKYGVDTTHMSPKQVWDSLREKGVTEQTVAREYKKNVVAERDRLEKRYGSVSVDRTDEVNTKRHTNIQLFAAKLSDQTENELKRSERSYLKRIKQHEQKIANPEKFIEDYKNQDIRYKRNILYKWEREIVEFNKCLKKVRERLYGNGKRDAD